MSRAERMTSQLQEVLTPVHLELTDESHQHSVPAGAESHFNLLIVSPVFEGKRLVQRHQAGHIPRTPGRSGTAKSIAATTKYARQK